MIQRRHVLLRCADSSLNHEWSKTASFVSCLDACLEAVGVNFKGFGSGLMSFTQNLMQTRCSNLSSIADKIKHEVEKALVWKQCMFTMRCHVADWYNRLAEAWPWPPFSSSVTEQLQSPRTKPIIYPPMWGMRMPKYYGWNRLQVSKVHSIRKWK
jgi:hypothetical protein